MSALLADWNSTAVMPSVKVTSSKLPPNGVSINVMLIKITNPPSKTKESFKLMAWPLEAVSIQKALPSKKELEALAKEGGDVNKTMALLNGDTMADAPHEDEEAEEEEDEAVAPPVEIGAFEKPMFFSYYDPSRPVLNPPQVVDLPLILNGLYKLSGVTYKTYTKKDGSGEGISFEAKLCEPCKQTFADFKIPFALRSINRERDCKVNDSYDQTGYGAMVIVHLENGVATDEPPFCVGKLGMPEKWKPEFLQRKKFGTQDDADVEMCYSNGAAKAVMHVLQCNEEGVVQNFLIRLSCYPRNFMDLHIEQLDTWLQLAPVLLPVISGYIVGSVNRESTAGCQCPDDKDGVLDLSATFYLDVPKMVQSVGVKISATTLAGLCMLNDLRGGENWKESTMFKHQGAKAINLLQVQGDASGVLAAMEKEKCTAWVVSPLPFDPLRAASEEEKLAAFKAVEELAIYVVGDKVRDLIKPAQVAKRGRAN